MAFSFHHSRAEGWAAIYEAVARAGLFVVAAHPVHAELRAASPKTATSSPISLDAILVCRKQPRTSESRLGDVDVLRHVRAQVHRLKSAGMSISGADRFVIGAAQMLVAASGELLPFDEIRDRLESLRLHLAASDRRPMNGSPV